MRYFLFLLLALSYGCALAVSPPYLVKDIHDVPNSASTEFGPALKVGDRFFFTARNADGGLWMWVTDATFTGTVPLRLMESRSKQSLDSLNLAESQGRLFFPAQDENGVWQLCVSDGTIAGTQMLSSDPLGLYQSGGVTVTADGRAFFVMNTPAGADLWVSDGTVGGTVQVTDIRPSSHAGLVKMISPAGNRAVFTVSSALWSTDGTAEGTQLLPMSVNFDNDQWVTFGQSLLIVGSSMASGEELWRTDGTVAGTSLVKDINPGAESAYPQSFHVNGDMVYFTAKTAAAGFEAWKSNGTPEGTVLIKDIRPGSADGSGWNFFTFGDRVGFLGLVPPNYSYTGLYLSDGTTNGTVLAYTFSSTPQKTPVVFKNEIYFGDTFALKAVDGTGAPVRKIEIGTPLVTTPVLKKVVGNRLFFEAYSGQGTNADAQVWSTDGTDAGTVQVGGLHSVLSSDSYAKPELMAEISGKLVLPSSDASHGMEMWVTDGMTAATGMLAEISSGTADSGPDLLCNLEDRAYFTAYDPVNGFALWRSEAVASGCTLVKPLSTSMPQASKRGYGTFKMLGFYQNAFYFSSYIAELSETGLWKSDGTAEGTVKLVAGLDCLKMVLCHDRAYFIMGVAGSGGALYETDGTVAGTQRVFGSTVQPPLTSVNVCDAAEMGGELYLSTIYLTSTSPRTYANGIWKVASRQSAVFADNMTQVKMISPDSSFQRLFHLTNLGGRLHFIVAGGAFNEWWQSDGTAAGTVALKQDIPALSATFAKLSGRAVLMFSDYAGYLELWSSESAAIPSVRLRRSSTQTSLPLIQDDTLYWMEGPRLYHSSGTPATTELWLDLRSARPLPDTQTFSDLKVIDGRLYVIAQTSTRKRELWTTDGTLPGTRLVAPLSAISGLPKGAGDGWVATSSRLFFVQSGAGVGRELHALALQPELQLSHGQTFLDHGGSLDLGEGFEGTGETAAAQNRKVTVKNVGLKSLTLTDVHFTGENGGDFSRSPLELPVTLHPDEETAFLVSFNPQAVGARQAVLHLQSDDVRHATWDLNLTGTGLSRMVGIPAQPESKLFRLGQSGFLMVGGSGMDLQYQWRKGTQSLTGDVAKNPTLLFATASAGDLGVYQVEVRNELGAQWSLPAYVGILTPPPAVVQIREGGALSLSVSAKVPAGLKLEYQWQFAGDELPGQTRPVLKLLKAQADQSGIYACRVRMLSSDGDLLAENTAGETEARIMDEVPVVTSPVFPDRYVAEVVNVNVTATNFPTRFSANGLPPGVAIDPLTGVIHGRPTAAKKAKNGVVPYLVKITAQNSAGSFTTPAVPWTVLELPAGFGGTFEALVARHESNQNLGGWLRLTATGTGSVSGTATVAGVKYTFRSSLNTVPGEGGGALTGRLKLDLVLGKTAVLPVDLTLSEADGACLITGTLKGAAVDGWQCPYSAKNPFSIGGSINTALIFSGESATGTGSSARPRGDGFAVVKISSAGTVTWTGTLADGTAFTASHLLGRSDGTPASTATFLHVPLYAATGSVHGRYDILPGPPLRLEGQADWLKGVQPEKVKSQDYKGGFGPLSLSLLGQIYERPGAGELVLGLDPVLIKNGVLSLTEGGLASFDYLSLGNDEADVLPTPYGPVDFPFQISSKGAGVYKPWDNSSSASLKNKLLLSIAPATGQVSGSFVLQTLPEISPARSAKIPWSGLIVPHPEVQAGVGFFRVFQREAGQFPPVPAKVPYESGRVRLRAYLSETE